jgi:DNA-binding NarL/FixJ family response regulator
MFMPASVVIADDSTTVRVSVRERLIAGGEFSIVAEADNGREALERVNEFRPDILIADIRMPEMNGIELTRAVRNGGSGTRVIAFSLYINRPYVVQAFRAGARGYLVKTGDYRGLVDAIRTVYAGHLFLDDLVLEMICQQLPELQRSERKTPLTGLSDEQLRCLPGMLRQHTTGVTAHQCGCRNEEMEAKYHAIRQILGVADHNEFVELVLFHTLSPLSIG